MITIIQYNAGNTRSVLNAMKRLGVEAIVSNEVEMIRQADKVIFPGVGEASSAMRFLRSQGLDTVIRQLTQPVLGICLGQQLLCQHSEEGDTDCLGIFPQSVKAFPPKDKVPHIGWNNFSDLKGALFQGVQASDDVYFVHGFYAELGEESIATTDYILPFSAAMQKDNFYAVQFHPEKSGVIGERILMNFLKRST